MSTPPPEARAARSVPTALGVPRLSEVPARTVRRGHFWVPGEPVRTRWGLVQSAPMYVEWEAPAAITRPDPIVLVHGGGGQLTDWRGLADGGPGWMERLVDEGYLVYAVDRPSHGRSWAHPDVVGEPGPPFTYELASALFAADVPGHDQAPWGDAAGDAVLDQLVAGMGYLPADLAASQRRDRDSMARLLDRIGPAVVMTHSAGAPAAWLACDIRPELVLAVVAIEPMGPPFASLGPGVELACGLTATPMTTEPAGATADELRAQDGGVRLPALAGVPVVVVVGGSSPFAGWADQVVAFIERTGGRAELLNLADQGVRGNGHGLMLERNADAALRPVLGWLAAREH